MSKRIMLWSATGFVAIYMTRSHLEIALAIAIFWGFLVWWEHNHAV